MQSTPCCIQSLSHIAGHLKQNFFGIFSLLSFTLHKMKNSQVGKRAAKYYSNLFLC